MKRRVRHTSSPSDSNINSNDVPTYYSRFEQFHHPIRHPPSEPPSLFTGYVILFASVSFLILGSYATLFSTFVPKTGVYVLDLLANDKHYKYFAILLIPTTAYFVIANWVGWQYYRNS